MIGVSVFLIGSALCGLSQEMWQLILFRGIQGLGAGALFPVALAIIGDIFAPSERGKYQGFFGAMFGVAFLIGPAIGGLITDYIGWHVDLLRQHPARPDRPVRDLANAAGPPRPERGPQHHRLPRRCAADRRPGAHPRSGFTNKQFGEWTDPDVGGLILLGLVFTALFIWAESRAKDPIVPLHMFRIRAFRASVVAMFLAAFGFFAAVVFMPRWFQVVDGSSATQSGYQILPLVGGLIVAAIVSGQLVARTGRYKPIILGSMLLLAFGLFLLTTIRPDTPLPLLWLYMGITGLGIGPAFAVFTLVVQNSVPMEELGAGTSSLTLFQQVGGTVGLAITGTLFGIGPAGGDPEAVRGSRSAAGVLERVRRRRERRC